MVKQTKSTDSQDNVVKETITGPSSAAQYVAIVPMTFEERYKMYMRCKKEELARMLAERDQMDLLFKQAPQPNFPNPYPYPVYPIGPYYGPIITCDAQNTSIA